MKIANIMFGGKKGGIEQAMVDYCRALHMMGHDSNAIVRANAAILPYLTAAKIPTRTLRMPHRWNPMAATTLRGILAGYDMVIVHGNRAGALVRRAGTIPIVAVAHSRFFTPHPYFDAIIALSPEKAEALRRTAPCPVHVVPNMIDMPENLAPRAAFSTPPTLGVMGRFDPVKGIDLFLEALVKIRAEFGPIRVRLGGDGAQRDELQTLATQLGVEDCIEWLGWVQDKAAFFASIDLYCLSSRSETFPITLLEAMAHGVPSIATDCGGPAAILTSDTGMLVPITADGIAEGLMRALRDPAASQHMGKAGHALAHASYATPVVAKRLHETLLSIHNDLHGLNPEQPRPISRA